jgi:hypothetical protein
MVLTEKEIVRLVFQLPGESVFSMGDLITIMKEVERLTREETRDDICNRLDDWVHAVVYPEAGE